MFYISFLLHIKPNCVKFLRVQLCQYRVREWSAVKNKNISLLTIFQTVRGCVNMLFYIKGAKRPSIAPRIRLKRFIFVQESIVMARHFFSVRLKSFRIE